MNNKQPSKKRFVSLGTKFILLVVFILLTTMSVASYINVQMQKKIIIEQLTAKGHTMGSFISLISADAILGYDFMLLDRYMQEISHQADVVYGIIVSPEKTSLSSYINKEHPYIAPRLGDSSSTLTEVIDRVNTNDHILPLAFEINNAGETIGSVLIGLSTERAEELAQRVMNEQLVEIVFIILFLSLCIYYVFRRNALRPIQDLINSSERLAMGDVDHKANIISNDELGTLARSFNQMTDSLNKSHAEKDQVVAQLLNANKNLEAATRAKSAFLANMSHEIRTPLTAIVGFGDYLKEPDIPMSDRSKAIDSIVQNGIHLQQIINDILDLSKVEAEKLEVERIEVSLFELIKHIEALLSMQTRDRSLTYSIDYDFPLPQKIITDPLRYKQILINICNNAIKFTEKGTVHVNISFQRHDHKLRVDVKDTGMGLEADQLDKVFEAFTQADSSTSRKYGGTGLGLPLSRQLAEMLGGTINVTSTPGIGSCFSITIDPGKIDTQNFVEQMPADLDKTHKKQHATNNITLSGNILLAEDTIDNQRLLSMYIHKSGGHVDIANNGQEAVEAALANNYDLILMDMQMPIMDGMQAVKILREKAYNKPIAALTANAMKKDREYCLDAGCDDFLAKPVDRNQFFELLKKYLTVGEIDNTTPITSTMDDDEFQDIIDMFVERLPATQKNIHDAYAIQDWERLTGLAHELKGVSGSLGFPSLTEVSGTIEKALKNKLHDGLQAHMSELDALIKRIVAAKAKPCKLTITNPDNSVTTA
jgi:signal transduction histidine kinase/CheY-like chemotaxis protein/HPt (histidine-containing phosphotransfer) domain-containing protein